MEQATHSIPEGFFVEVVDASLGDLDLAALWNMLGVDAQAAISSAATSFPQPHGLMLDVAIDCAACGELTYLNLPESSLAQQGLEDFLGNFFGTDPLADRAAIRALVRSAAPPSVPQVQNLFGDLLDLVETPTSMYVVPFGPDLDRDLDLSWVL